MKAPLRMESAALTHPGLVRRANEDSFCERTADGLWAVADGMGGHAHGDWASRTLVGALADVSVAGSFDDAAQVAAGGIYHGNRMIWREARRREQQMGSTVVVLLVRDTRFAILWVGDSRAYLLRGGLLHQLSRDHTQVQELVDRGLIRPDEARSHPRGHVLARAVGVAERIEVDVVVDEVEPGDLFLLCSDGLTGLVSDVELAELLAGAGGRQAIAGRLVALALERGAPDNVTVVLVSAQEATLLSLAGPGGFA
ncbi:MAG: PP2C family protein-serine/threonine phosphatase [Janthinobacterium lividum]